MIRKIPRLNVQTAGIAGAFDAQFYAVMGRIVFCWDSGSNLANQASPVSIIFFQFNPIRQVDPGTSMVGNDISLNREI